MGGDDGFVSAVAPSLTRVRERLWIADSPAEPPAGISYPALAHATLAGVEDSSFWFRHRNKVILAMISRFPPGGAIVDVGGGNGYVAAALERRGFPSIVVEPGPERARAAHDRGLTVVGTDFRRDMFAPGRLPALGLFDVIEHIADDRTFLAECRTALAERGLVYITVPAVQALWSSDDEFAGHRRRYDRRSMSDTLRQAGFEVLALSYFFSLLVPAIYLSRTLPTAVGWRTIATVHEAIRFHRVAPRISRLAERMLLFEPRAVASGHRVPIGSSLLAVARKCGSAA